MLTVLQELARSNQETHKLDLMAEISSLKLRLASSDKDRADLRERLDFAQVRRHPLVNGLKVGGGCHTVGTDTDSAL